MSGGGCECPHEHTVHPTCSNSSIWRAASYSTACTTWRILFKFFISTRCPYERLSSAASESPSGAGLTLTFTSHRMEPSSMWPSQTPTWRSTPWTSTHRCYFMRYLAKHMLACAHAPAACAERRRLGLQTAWKAASRSPTEPRPHCIQRGARATNDTVQRDVSAGFATQMIQRDNAPIEVNQCEVSMHRVVALS